VTNIVNQIPTDVLAQPECSGADYKDIYKILQAITQWASNIGLTVNEDGELVVQTSIDATGATLNVPADVGINGDALTALQALAGAISGTKMLTTEDNSGSIKTATEAVAAIISGGKLLTTETSAAAIKTATEALAAIISGGKLLTTETSAAAIKTATEALAAIISGGKLLVTETSGSAIKTAVEALAAIISGGKLLTTESSAATIAAALATLNGAGYAKKKVVTAKASRTGSATITATGTRLTIKNRSQSSDLTIAVGGFTSILDFGDSETFDYAQFTEFTVTCANSAEPWNYVVEA